MAWYDTRFNVSLEEINFFFPNSVTTNLYKDSYNKRFLIIFDKNIINNDSRYREVKDYLKYEVSSYPFAYPFFDKDISIVDSLIKEISLNKKDIEQNEQVLLLKEEIVQKKIDNKEILESIFLYSDFFSIDKFIFFLCSKDKDDSYLIYGAFELDRLIKDHNYISLLLKRHLLPCPVCNKKSITIRSMYEICPYCGWEDDGSNDLDDEGVDGLTIRQARKIYLEKIEKAPLYRWDKDYK